MVRKAVQHIETNDEIENVFTIPPPLPDRDDDVISALESELDGLTGSSGAYVNVYRLAQGKPDAYLIRLAPEDFSIENVKQQYGGGVYRIRAYRRNELRQSRIFRNDIITVAETKEPDKLPAYAPAPATDVTSALIASLQDGFSRLGAMILEARPQPETEERMLNKMMLYKQLFAPAVTATPTAPPMSEMLGAVKEVLALSNSMREYSGEGGGGPDSMSVLMKALDTFGKPLVEGIVAAQAAAPGAPEPQMHHLQPQPQPQQQIPYIQKPGDEMMMKNVMLKMYLGELCDVASKKADPGLYADVVLDRIPDAALAELIMPTDWLEKMIAAQPAVGLHRAWFTELREIVHTELTAPDDSDIPPTADTAGIPDVPPPDSKLPSQ